MEAMTDVSVEVEAYPSLAVFKTNNGLFVEWSGNQTM
jgi:hypothetical protein